MCIINYNVLITKFTFSSARSCLVSLISEIDKGSVTNTDPITPGTAISITCDTGYDLTPSTPVTCTTRLDTRNLYSGDLPTCQGKFQGIHGI